MSSYLSDFIEQATKQLLIKANRKNEQDSEASTSRFDSLFFLGNQHDVVPRRLLLDPILSPREKYCWQLIRLNATENKLGAAFPSYDELQVLLSNFPKKEKASRSTVSLTLLMLRLTRWLSLCHRARHTETGRVLGNIYALHDEPLSLLDAQTFDYDYLKLLIHCYNHNNPRLNNAANEILDIIFNDENLRYLSSRLSLYEDRMLWQQQNDTVTESVKRTQPISPGFHAKSADKTQQDRQSPERRPSFKKDKNHLKSVDSRTVLRENSTTTVSNNYIKIQVPHVREGTIELLFPLSLKLNTNEQVVIFNVTKFLEPHLAQEVIDETARKIERGGIKNPLAYLLATLRKAKDGQFNILNQSKITQSNQPTSPSPADNNDNISRRSSPEHVQHLLTDLKKKYGLSPKK